MKLLAAGDHCSPEILKLIAAKPKIRERMREVGFIPLPDDHPRRWQQVRPARSRQVVKKFGIDPPKRKPWILGVMKSRRTPRRDARPSGMQRHLDADHREMTPNTTW
jgi:hypothetical protein